MKTIVGVSDLRVSGNFDEELITFALGSCLGVAVYDPEKNVGGLLHAMLPLSKMDHEKAKSNPAMYVDTGLTHLLNRCYDMGAASRNLKIYVAGGASMKQSEDEDYFKIGKRNITVLRKLLWKNGFMIHALDVGGMASRTMMLRMSDGVVFINKKPLTANSMADYSR